MLKQVGPKRALPYAVVMAFVFGAPQQIAATPIAPAPAITESFDVGTLHVDQYGRGKPALILIPGLASGVWSWYGTIAHFETRYTVYALTLAGFDGRPAAIKEPLFATFASDFNHLLDLRNIEQPIVMGHSLGGTLAIMMGEQDGSRLKAIVAVDGLPVFPAVANLSESDRKAFAEQSAKPIAKLTPSAEVAYEQRFMSTIGTIDPAFADSAAIREARSDPTAIAQWLQADLMTDLRPDLSKIRVPLLEIMPYYAPDHQHPPLQFTQAETVGFYQSLLAGAPHVTVVPISDSRHFVMFDQPQAFYAAVESFTDAL
jgi:pimeloyl-ACP methyl ester carboxylesterase